jgi:selenocysteine lyase/cysteine desulfurase
MLHRGLFPVCQQHVYLNNAGVAPTSTPVVARVQAWMDNLLQHGVFHEESWEKLAEDARARLGKLVGAEADEIAFVRNTSHGLGLVAEGLDWQAGDEVAVCTAAEYPSNVYPWQHLAGRGVRVCEVPASASGGVEVEAVRRVLTPRTRLVAVSAVQYASGHRTDLAALGELCRARGVLLCVDGIQQVGAAPLDVKACGIHFLASDSHKWMLGIPGIGFLFVDRDVSPRIRPSLVGWKSTAQAWNFDRPSFVLRADAAKLEEGTPPYPLMAGLDAAVRLLLETGLPPIAAHIAAWLARTAEEAAAMGYRVTPDARERAGILLIQDPRDSLPPQDRPFPETFEAVHGAALARACDAARVRVSLRRGRLRVSPHIYNDEADREALLEVLRRHRSW